MTPMDVNTLANLVTMQSNERHMAVLPVSTFEEHRPAELQAEEHGGRE